MEPFERDPECLFDGPPDGALPIHAVRPQSMPDLLARLTPSQAAYLSACPFRGEAGQVVLLPGGPGEPGVAGAVLGLGETTGPHVFGALPAALPDGTRWQLASGIVDPADAVLGWALGAYRFDRLHGRPVRKGPRLRRPDASGAEQVISTLRAVWLARDLINMPANLLGPSELAEIARDVLVRAGAEVDIVAGRALADRFPMLHAVGRGSARPPAMVLGRWRHAAVGEEAPLLSLCGKGVCFDSGGYDLKTAGGMLRMKKDMGGAAVALGLARMIIEASLPVRLELRLGCVENMVSGDAFRPLDILRTRNGVTIEVGNTDAEGRLVLCEMLTEASAEAPAALLDFATLTGAARVALGPDVPALFSNDDALAEILVASGRAAHDPVWRLPLWDGYNSWLDSSVGDMNNVTDKGHAGAIVAALFLQRFVPAGTRWAHFDVYAWNDSARPGRPSGGEAQAMRAAFAGLKHYVETTLLNNSSSCT